MKIKRIKVDKRIDKVERPYYVHDDNKKSDFKIEKLEPYSGYNTYAEITTDKNITKALVIENYFDTEYLSKIKKEAIQYPVNEKLGE